HGKVGPIPYDVRGWVNITAIAIDVTLDTALSNGTPHITVRPGSVPPPYVGTITTNFGGIDGWIIDHVVTPLAQSSLQAAVGNQIQSFVVNNFDGLTDGIVSGLDIESLGTSFGVPKLDGSGTLSLNFGVGFSTLSTSPSRMLFGIG